MNKLFVYYSLSGNGDFVAEIMRDNGYDILKLETAKRMPKGFVARILAGGFLAGIGNKAKLVTDISGINGYDKVVVGSPVWNGRLAPAINTLVAALDRPFDVICYSGSGNSKRVKKQLKDKPLGALIDITEPVKYPEECRARIAGYLADDR